MRYKYIVLRDMYAKVIVPMLSQIEEKIVYELKDVKCRFVFAASSL